MDKQEAIERLKQNKAAAEFYAQYVDKFRLVDNELKDIEAFNMAIEALSVDRPKGEWIDKGEYAECSICGAHTASQFDGVELIPLKTKFCHNCGAEMKIPLYVYASWDRSEE